MEENKDNSQQEPYSDEGVKDVNQIKSTADTPAKPIKKNVFKENWLKVDETCPGCGHVTKRQKGMTRQNLRRLITPKFDFNEAIMTFMIIMVVILALVYNSETKQCRDWINSMYGSNKEMCEWNCGNKCTLIEEGLKGKNATLPSLNGLNGTLLNVETNENELNGFNGMNYLNSTI